MTGWKTPQFWYQHAGIWAWCLWPFSYLWRIGHMIRQLRTPKTHFPIPVICVGNLVVGGTGKTPLVRHLSQFFNHMDIAVHCISKGYGGKKVTTTPILVDILRHQAHEVGDEPLLLAEHAPCWVGNSRVRSINAALNCGAELALLDDGYQDPSIYKPINIITIDSQRGFGNRHILPAGPLRERLGPGLKRADIVVTIGPEKNPDLEAQLKAQGKWITHARPVLIMPKIPHIAACAFAGIAHPQKFFDALEQYGIDLREKRAFADHQDYRHTDLATWIAQQHHHETKPDDASQSEMRSPILTTQKDFVRLPPALQKQVIPVPLRLELENPIAFETRILALIDEHTIF